MPIQLPIKLTANYNTLAGKSVAHHISAIIVGMNSDMLPDTLPDDLPAWMRPRHRVIDWALLVICACALLIALPLIASPGLPRHTDAALFVARGAQTAQIMRSGTLYSRWASDFYFGLGSPLFNYLPPLPHWLVGVHQFITDANPIDSVKVLIGLSLLAAGVGMYGFVRDRYGARAGLLSGLIYLSSPPLALTLSYQRGDLSALLSLSLLPWALWTLDRLAQQPTRRAFVTAVLTLAAWSLADVRMTVLGAFCVAVVIASSKRRYFSLSAIAVALLITAFYWLPALAEQDAVQWIPLAADPNSAPITLLQNFVVPPIAAPHMINPAPYQGLGLGVSLAALIGGLTLFYDYAVLRDRTPFMGALVAFAIGGGAGVLIASVAEVNNSAGAWQPLQAYHWLSGLALPCLTIVAGAAAASVEHLPKRLSIRPAFALTAFLALPTLLTITPALSTTYWPASAALTTANDAASELAIHAPGSLRNGLLLPIAAYRAGAPLATIAINTLPENTLRNDPSVLPIEDTPLSSRFTVALGTIQRVSFKRYAFPGWFVGIDNMAYPAESSSQGFVALTLPKATREVVVAFGSTPTRTFSWLIVLIGGVLLITRLRLLRETAVSENERLRLTIASASLSASVLVSRREAAAVGIAIGLCALSGLCLRSIQSANLLAAFPPTPIASYPAVGIELSMSTRDADGQSVLLWRAQHSIRLNYQLEARLIRDVDGQEIGRREEWYPGGIPTSQWTPDQLVRDPLLLPITAGAHIEVALAQCATPQTLPCDKPTPLTTDQGGTAIVLR